MDYLKELYMLPFDHRASFFKGLLGFEPPLSSAQHKKVTAYKQVVFDGFMQVYKAYSHKDRLAILVDEDFGMPILKAAKAHRIINAVSVERSGKDFFDFEYGDHYKEHLLRLRPSFAKVLVRYNPANNNSLQLRRLARLSDFCAENGIGFMFELLVPATEEQKKRYKKSYDTTARPALMVQAIEQIVKYHIHPTVWKIEAVETKPDWKKIIKATQLHGHRPGIIVLGRGEDEKKVVSWLKLGATFPEVIGFAVGRTVFYPPLFAYRDAKITKKQASGRIAKNYTALIRLWEKSRKKMR